MVANRLYICSQWSSEFTGTEWVGTVYSFTGPNESVQCSLSMCHQYLIIIFYDLSPYLHLLFMDLSRVWVIYYFEHNALYWAHHRTRWPINWCHDAEHVILPKIEHLLETGLTITFDGQNLFSDTSDPWSMTTGDLIDTDQYWCGTLECLCTAHSYSPALQHLITLSTYGIWTDRTW